LNLVGNDGRAPGRTGFMTTILVTGATGTVGTGVVRMLGDRGGITVRAGVRAPGQFRAFGRVVPVAFDYEKPELMKSALDGTDALFLLAPSLRDQVGASARLIELAKAAGVKRVVKLSALGCDQEPTISFGRAHRDVERILASSGLAWTALRPNNFMENFLGKRHGSFAPNPRGEIALPWGDAACSFISAEDIARVAARVLTTDGHDGKAYDLTGPEAVTIARAAELMSSAAGRTIRYVDVAPELARKFMLEAHLPPPLVDAVLELHALGKSGRAAKVTQTVEELTGVPACAFADFTKAHAAEL
jgi:uncharacterized protein YbjT (DUF2867 family)